MRKIIALVLALSVVFTSAAFAEGTLRVGMECDYAPFNWTQAEESEMSVPIEGGGYADGYDVQIAKKLAEALDKELVIVKTAWDGLPMSVLSGTIDCIIAGMSPTEERKLTLEFTDPYYTSDLVIVVRKDGAYANATTLSDFAGANITGQLNTFHYTVIDQIEGVNKINAMETFPAMIVALNAGTIDGYVSERPGAVSACESNSDLTFISFAEGEGFVASESDVAVSVGVMQGSELTAPINEALAAISNEERQQMMDDAIARQPVTE